MRRKRARRLALEPVARPGNLTVDPRAASLAGGASLSHDGKAEWAVDHLDPAWDDRIEAIYISTQGLATCQTGMTTIAVGSAASTPAVGDRQLVETGCGPTAPKALRA